MTVWSDLGYPPEVVALLERKAVLPKIAERAGIRVVRGYADAEDFSYEDPKKPRGRGHSIRKEYEFTDSTGATRKVSAFPGVVVMWRSADGREEPQFTPLARPFDPKYVFPKGTASLLSLIQQGDGDTVWIVEGTFQHLAAASYAPPDVTILGLMGAPNWKGKGREGQPLPGLELVEDRTVYLMFDADVETNPDVKAQADNLTAACLKLGALDVLRVRIPAVDGAKTGLDDYLAANGSGSREERLARLIREAAPTDDGRTLSERMRDRDDGRTITRKGLRGDFERARAELDAANAPKGEPEEGKKAKKPTKAEQRRAEWVKRNAEMLVDTLGILVGGGVMPEDRCASLVTSLVKSHDANVDSVVRFLGEKWREPARQARTSRIMKSGSHVEMSQRLLMRLDWSGEELVHCMGSFYTYDRARGLWSETNPKRLTDAVHAMDGMEYLHVNAEGDDVRQKKRVNSSDVDGILKCAASAARDDSFFSTAENGIAFRNGFLRVRDDGSTEFGPHSPKNRAVSAQPFDYSDSPAKPERWLQFVSELWGDDADSPRLLHMMLGYLLTRDWRQEKAFVLLGPSGAGKGTILKVMCALLGTNWTPFSINRLGNEFGCASLVGKNVAIDADFRRSSGRDKDEGSSCSQLLKLVSNDPLTFGIKGKGDFNGQLGMRCVIAANPPFGIRDAGKGMARRWCVLPFSRQFKERPDVEKGEGLRDERLSDKLVAEMPGILHLALEGLRDLAASGCFPEPEAGKEMTRGMSVVASPVDSFVNEYCIIEEGAQVQRQELYEAMQSWAKVVGRTPGARDTFKEALASFGVVEKRDNMPRTLDGRRGKGAPYYVGIRLDEDAFEEIRNSANSGRGFGGRNTMGDEYGS